MERQGQYGAYATNQNKQAMQDREAYNSGMKLKALQRRIASEELLKKKEAISVGHMSVGHMLLD